MPLCHWPCSCYPNHSLGQIDDWMNEIYERWVAAHGVILVTPVYWYQAPSPLKLMIDRLVCADGGNPDPTTTPRQGRRRRPRRSSSTGWDYPKHLAGRAYGVVVHGDVAGIEGAAARALATGSTGWASSTPAPQARLDRYIGYYEPYATSHDTLKKKIALQLGAAGGGKEEPLLLRLDAFRGDHQAEGLPDIGDGLHDRVGISRLPKKLHEGRSILTLSTSRLRRWVRLEYPVPKSSSAILDPAAR